jgi:two-component system sensor histidine kinase VanS
LDSSRASSTGGAGLGLAIAKEIVELHGGSIAAKSADESIAFTVTLPMDCQKIV